MNIHEMFSAAVLMSLYVTSCMSVSPSQGGTLHYCDVLENWSNYTKMELVTVDDFIFDIAISKHTEKIYVAYGWHNIFVMDKNGSNTYREIGSYINCLEVDHYLPRVYIGTNRGLLIYDEVTGIITNVTEVQYGVRSLFVAKNNGDVYVTNGYDKMVYRYQNMFTEETNLNLKNISNKIANLVVDLAGNYYINYHKFSENRIIINFRTNILLKEHNVTLTYNDGPFECLTVDNIGRVFGTVDHDVYYLKVDGTTQKVATLDFTPRHMCFDEKNNVVFGTGITVIMLEFINTCSSSPAPEVDITSNMDALNIKVHDITKDLENINAGMNKIVSQNEYLMEEIKSLRNTQNYVSNAVDQNKVKLENVFMEMEKKY